MSLLDRVRLWPAAAGDTDEAGGSRPPVPRWQLVGGGLVAALASWAVVAVLGLLAWMASPQAEAGLGDTLGVATALWFLGSGGRVVASGVPFEVVPLGYWALAVWLTSLALRHTLRLAHQGERATGWPQTLVREVLPLFAAGYAVPVLVFGLASFAGPAHPTLAGLLGVFTVPLGALLLVALRPDEPEAVVIEALVEPVPLWLRRSVAPALWGAVGLLGAGALVVLGALVWRFEVVLGLHQSVDAGWVGGIVLLLAQLAYLPTFAVWGLSWLAGPGFDVAAGGTVTVSGAQPGLLPLVPVLGAVPPEGSYPGWVTAALWCRLRSGSSSAGVPVGPGPGWPAGDSRPERPGRPSRRRPRWSRCWRCSRPVPWGSTGSPPSAPARLCSPWRWPANWSSAPRHTSWSTRSATTSSTEPPEPPNPTRAPLASGQTLQLCRPLNDNVWPLARGGEGGGPVRRTGARAAGRPARPNGRGWRGPRR